MIPTPQLRTISSPRPEILKLALPTNNLLGSSLRTPGLEVHALRSGGHLERYRSFSGSGQAAKVLALCSGREPQRAGLIVYRG